MFFVTPLPTPDALPFVFPSGVNTDEFMSQFDVDQLTVSDSMVRSGSQLSVREQVKTHTEQ